MIHDTLIQHFQSLPEPQLSEGFSARLRVRLEGGRRPRRRTAAAFVIRRWAPRVYWIAAGILVVATIRQPTFAPEHLVAMAVAGLVSLLAVQRALRPGRLTRILRDALLR